MSKLSVVGVLMFCGVLLLPAASFASVDMLKDYREVNPDLKPNCMYCHVDKLPKKEAGKHEINAYGSKIKELLSAQKEEMTAEEKKQAHIAIFKQLGRHDAADAGAATGK